MEPERLHVLIKGDVQGVGFRYFLLHSAESFGLRGWVRNRNDDAVELIVEGPRAALEQILLAARRGPRLARIAEVDVEWLAAAGDLDRFDVIG